MADFIKINTKYARRDIARMESAISNLEDAEQKYKELQAHVETVYFGDAAKALWHTLAIEGTRCNLLAANLRTAADSLRKTVETYESYSKKMANAIQGK